MSRLIKIIALTLALALICPVLAGCGDTKNADIVTTLYPQYDIAKQIAHDKLSVSLIVPFGSEIHGYEPTAKDIVAINKAKLFIFTSFEMERWVGGVVSHDVNALNLSGKYTLAPYDPNDADTLHYWTDPTVILQLINVVRDEIIKIDPENEAYYTQNANSYYEEIENIHREATEYFSAKAKPLIFFAGHNAMGAFGKRYNLSITALSENFQPDADLTPRQLQSIIAELKETGAHYLFIEELVEPRAAQTIINQLANENYELTLLELHGYHNISKEQNKQGVRYADLFKRNLANIKKALGD